MNRALKVKQESRPTVMPECYCGRITGFNQAQQCWVIDHQFQAKKAVSLMVNPELADQVSFIALQDHYIIVQLLTRDEQQQQLTLHSDRNVQWITPNLSVKALDSMELVAANSLTVMAKNLVNSALSSLLLQSENLLQEARQFSAKATALMRLSGKQQIITAEEDVRIDGERINLG